MSNVTYEAKGISKKFGQRTIIDNLNYKFISGNIYAILGESGSGKTTLLNILGLLDNNFKGELNIDSETIDKRCDNFALRNEKIGFVFQSYYLIDYLSVEDNIKAPLAYSKRKLDSEYYNYLIKKLNLDQIINEKVNYLSGGEKQRVSLARALINKPQIIICDEPTGNLDSRNADQVLSILRQFLSADKIIIIVTHDKNVAHKCDRILELQEGKLHENI
ncbi:MAG: ABC transporter ATP-binding protein [Bacilli bacterium]|nr:ABC transporter ATP-binding protein [Bacilli bacterium]